MHRAISLSVIAARCPIKISSRPSRYCLWQQWQLYFAMKTETQSRKENCFLSLWLDHLPHLTTVSCVQNSLFLLDLKSFWRHFSFGGWFPLFPQPPQIIALQKSDHQLRSGSLWSTCLSKLMPQNRLPHWFPIPSLAHPSPLRMRSKTSFAVPISWNLRKHLHPKLE